MTLTQKETSLLGDLKAQEEICAQKYGFYADEASDPCLKQLFSSIRDVEQSHVGTIGRILGGEEVALPPAKTAASETFSCQNPSGAGQNKQKDAYLCSDALATEKHASALYDTCIFEFKSPVLRDTLNSIQKEEQIHGQQIYEYMEQNGMYS